MNTLEANIPSQQQATQQQSALISTITQSNKKKRGVQEIYNEKNEKFIPKQGIRKLARKAGVKRMSNDVYDDARSLLRQYIEQVLWDSLPYTYHARRKTVTAMDIVHGLKRGNTTLYGFDGNKK